MSSFRRLPGKSTSAPPRFMSSGGTTEDQMQAIENQKQRTSELEQKLFKFTSKVKTQKEDSKQERHKQHWLSERSLLFKDRQQAQQELEIAMNQLQLAFANAEDSDKALSVAVAAVQLEYRNDRSASADEASAITTALIGLRARVGAFARDQSTRRPQDAHVLQEAINHMRDYINDAGVGLNEDIDETMIVNDGMSKLLRDFRPTGSDGDQVEVGLLFESSSAAASNLDENAIDSIESITNALFDEIRARFPKSSDEAQGVFRAALCNETEKIRDKELRLMKSGATRPSNVQDGDLVRIGMLVKSYDPSRNRAMFGKTREDLFERIVHDLPHLTLSEAQAAVHYISDQKSRVNQRKRLIADFSNETKQLRENYECVARAEEDSRAADEVLQQEALRVEEENNRRRTELERLRAEYDERVSAKFASEEQVRLQKQAAEYAKQQQLQLEYEVRLKDLARFHQEKAEADERQRAIQREIAQAEEEKRQQETQWNQQRVAYRRQAFEERLHNLHLQQLLADEEAAQKQEQYEKFFASVQSKLGIGRDAQRVLKQTVTSSQTVGDGYVGVREATAVRITGYTSENILKDPRFRIHQALVAANLHHTAYARQVLTSHYHVPPAMLVSKENPLQYHH